MLTNYMKHNYKYDANNQRTEDEAQNGTVTKTAGKITSAFVILMAIKV